MSLAIIGLQWVKSNILLALSKKTIEKYVFQEVEFIWNVGYEVTCVSNHTAVKVYLRLRLGWCFGNL